MNDEIHAHYCQIHASNWDCQLGSHCHLPLNLICFEQHDRNLLKKYVTTTIIPAPVVERTDLGDFRDRVKGQ